MKKNLFILSAIFALAASLITKAVFAAGAQGGGGIVAVLVSVIDDENKSSMGEEAPKMQMKSHKSESKDNETKPMEKKGKGKKNKAPKNGAFNNQSLKQEFMALNSAPESLKLIQQSAGGSADLKAVLAD